MYTYPHSTSLGILLGLLLLSIAEVVDSFCISILIRSFVVLVGINHLLVLAFPKSFEMLFCSLVPNGVQN